MSKMDVLCYGTDSDIDDIITTLLATCCDDSNYDDDIKINTSDINDIYDICQSCGGNMHKNNNVYQCSICSNISNYINDDSTPNSNTSSTNWGTCDSEQYCKITGGVNATAHQRNLYPVLTAVERRRKMYNNAMTKLNMFNNNASMKNNEFPQHMLVETANMIADIQMTHDKSLKDTVYTGTLITCLSIVCKKYKLYQKSNVLCTFANIRQKDMTKQQKLIRAMRGKGIIDYQTQYNSSASLLTQYFTMFDIPMKYKEFAFELIETSSPHNNMMGDNNNTIDSKCAAVVAILQKKLNLPFTCADIVSKCNIVQSTYEKYCKYILLNILQLKIVFDKYDIPVITESDFQKRSMKKSTPVKPSVDPLQETCVKKRRGRPTGSMNKQKK